MADDARKRRVRMHQANAIVASAQLITGRRIERLAGPQQWQAELWDFYDTIGEVRFATGWFANALSRGRLLAARTGEAGDEPSAIVPPVEPREGEPEPEPLSSIEADAFSIMDQLAGGTTGQSRILADFGVQLSLPGLCYLVGEPSGPEGDDLGEIEPPDTWQVLSIDEIRVAKSAPRTLDDLTGEEITRYEVREGDGERDWRLLAPDVLVCKVWRSHPRWHYKPDSTMRAAIPVLRELMGLTAHIDATIAQRLAGAGILVLANEITFPVSEKNQGAEDPFMAELMDAMLTPIKDRDNASAVVPYVLRVKGEFVDKIKHLTFSTPFDEHAKELREEALRRYATTIDMPAEIVLGLGDANHWTAWQIEESALKLHIEPMFETICHGLTIGYLHPALRALGHDEAAIANLIAWYDASELTVRPDKSGTMTELYDRVLVGGPAVRREAGVDEADAPSEDEELRQLAQRLVLGAPTLLGALAPVLGLAGKIDESKLPGAEGASPPARRAGQPDDEEEPADGPPPTRDAPPPPPDEDQADAALVAACDGLVFRALEKAGNRLVSVSTRAGFRPMCGTPELVHTCMPDELRLSAVDDALDGVWTRVPEVAARHGVEPIVLRDTLDTYCRQLLQAGWPHEYSRLAAALGAT